MELPPYSPDLNPIKNLWFLLKEAIYKRRPDLLTMNGEAEVLRVLVETAPLAWEDIREDILKQLSDTMVHRVEAVRKADGWYTRY
jgi:hypothetical protein